MDWWPTPKGFKRKLDIVETAVDLATRTRICWQRTCLTRGGFAVNVVEHGVTTEAILCPRHHEELQVRLAEEGTPLPGGAVAYQGRVVHGSRALDPDEIPPGQFADDDEDNAE